MATNLYAQLQRLTAGKPLQVGTVISSGSGASTIQLPSGAQVLVRGTATVGAQVFFRDAIEGDAPSLPIVTATV